MTMRVLLVSRAALVASYRPKLEAIARRPGVELTVVVPPSWREPGRVQPLEPGPTPGYELVTERIAANGSFHGHWYPRLARRIAALHPDVVHVEEEPYNLATFLAARAAARHGARVVVFTWQNLDRRLPPPFSTMERATLARTDHLVCGSRAARDLWRARGYDGPTTVLPQVGVDPAVWTPRHDLAADAEGGARRFTVGYVGRLVPAKGVDVLVRAFAAASLPADARLVLLGDGPERANLVALADRLGIGARVEVTGWCESDALPARMRELDALVLPSRATQRWQEQFGRVLIEAMASGVAVVGSDTGEIPHVIGEAGVVFPEDDVDALRDALTQLAADPARRADLARRGRARVETEFTQERVAEATVRVYHATLAARPRVTIVAHEVHDGGGMEAAMAQLVRRATREFDVTIVAAAVDPGLRGSVRWRRVPTPAAPLALRLAVFGALAAPRVRASRADLVHTLGAIVPTRADLATVQYCHAGVPADARTAAPEVGTVRRLNATLAHRASVWAERWCYRPARLRRFAAVSPGVGAEVAAAYPGIPVTVTPNGVDTERFAPDAATRVAVRAELAVADDAPVALFVGGDWARKGLAIAIAAIGRAAASGTPVRLWVVGRGDAARYRQVARDAGVEALVTFLGFRADRERCFQGADLFLLPTRYETFCIAAFEGAAAGLPLVMTPVNDVRALVRDGTGGVLVDRTGTRDDDVVASIADALVTYARDPERRAADGAAARTRASAYTWEASAESVLDVYRELLEART